MAVILVIQYILVLKWRQVSPMKLQLQLAQENLYTKKDLKSSGIGSSYEKSFLISNELKIDLMIIFSLQDSLQSFESFYLIFVQKVTNIW